MRIAKFFIPSLTILLNLTAYGDSVANSPPDPWEDQGGKRAPAFSSANAEAIYYLSIVDNQAYASSWGEMGSLLRDLIPRKQWVGAMKATRLSLGSVRTRRVASHASSTVLKEGTRGEFMTIKYDTQFSQKTQAVETVILMRDGKLGLWKVISYTIGRR